MYGYIYRITDLTNGKCYIGQRKWNKPGIDLNYWGGGTIISNIVRKRKKEDRMNTLLREKLMDCTTLEELNYFETYFIEHMNTLCPNGYNLNTGGDVRKASDVTRAKLSNIHKGLKQTEATIEKRVSKLRGIPRPTNVVETIAKSLTKYHFSEDELYEQFIVLNKSIGECADYFGCSKDVISNRLKVFGIKKNQQLLNDLISKKRTLFLISKEELYRLYIQEGLSSSQIGDLYGCSRTPILRLLKKYKISKK